MTYPLKVALLLAMAAALISSAVLVRADTASSSGRQFLPISVPQVDRQKMALGRALFFDARLSRSAHQSCASCHDLSTNGATAGRADRDDSGHLTNCNTPTVFNSPYSARFGWAGRIRTLSDAVRHALYTALFGGDGVPERRLERDATMAARFRSIYHDQPNEDHIVDALSVFMDSLDTPSPFDRWLRGDRGALNIQQVRGYALFKGIGCASCHQGVNLGGNIMARSGVFRPLNASTARTNFRVPSLRNVAITAPYFHNGSAMTLSIAIDEMAQSQLDLRLKKDQSDDIVAFLQSLTGDYDGHMLKKPLRRGE